MSEPSEAELTSANELPRSNPESERESWFNRGVNGKVIGGLAVGVACFGFFVAGVNLESHADVSLGLATFNTLLGMLGVASIYAAGNSDKNIEDYPRQQGSNPV